MPPRWACTRAPRALLLRAQPLRILVRTPGVRVRGLHRCGIGPRARSDRAPSTARTRCCRCGYRFRRIPGPRISRVCHVRAGCVTGEGFVTAIRALAVKRMCFVWEWV